MAKKQDLKEVVRALEKIYDTLREMRERHETELKAVTEEVIAAFRRIQEVHPKAREVMEAVQSKEDELFNEARALVEEAGNASTSFLQRKLNIGYSRAARLIELLEEAGVIGPMRGMQPREVYVADASPAIEKVLKGIAKQLKKQKKGEGEAKKS